MAEFLEWSEQEIDEHDKWTFTQNVWRHSPQAQKDYKKTTILQWYDAKSKKNISQLLNQLILMEWKYIRNSSDIRQA